MTNKSYVGNDDLQNELCEFLTNYFYGGLTGISDSQDTAFLIIRKLMKEKTRGDFLDFAKICAKKFVNKLVSHGKDITDSNLLKDHEIDGLINEALFESYKEYQETNGV